VEGAGAWTSGQGCRGVGLPHRQAGRADSVPQACQCGGAAQICARGPDAPAAAATTEAARAGAASA